MSKKLFTDKEIRLLSKNKYIKKVSEKAITYTEEFRNIFIEQSNKGLFPVQIFEDAGLTVEILGKRRIEECAARWRKKYKNGDTLYDKRKYCSGRSIQRDLSVEEINKRLEAKILLLEAENELLKKADLIERGLIKKLKI